MTKVFRSKVPVINFIKILNELRERDLVKGYCLQLYRHGPYPEDVERALHEDPLRKYLQGDYITMTDSQIYDALRKGEEYLGIDRIRLLESKIREFKSIGVQGWGFNRGKDQAERYLIEPMKRNKLAWQVSPDIEKVIQKNDLERLKIVGGLPGELGIALTFRPEKDPVNFLIGLAKQLIRSKKSVKFGQNDWRFRPSALWREYREREHWNEIRGSFILWLGKIFKDEGGWFFTSVLYFRRAYDVVKLILWDGVQINPNKEYVVLGVVDEADNMPIIRVIGIFERASLT